MWPLSWPRPWGWGEVVHNGSDTRDARDGRSTRDGRSARDTRDGRSARDDPASREAAPRRRARGTDAARLKEAGPVILFEVDKRSDLPPWLQLRNRLAYLITSGHFKPGEKLPTVRGLAAEISINFNTVNKAYISLMDEGYIESRPGKGTIVREISPEKSEKLESVDTLIEDCVDACLAMGLDFDDVSKRIKKKIHEMERERDHG